MIQLSKIKLPRLPRRTGRPFIFVNMAMTADGKIASANREVASFAGAYDREQMLVLRGQADAVMAGALTVNSSPMNMGPGPVRFRQWRLKNGLAEFNLRVIVSGSAAIHPEAEIFRHRFSPILLLATESAGKRKLRRLEPLVDELKICGKKELDWTAALDWLKKKWNVTRLLCEGGGELNSSLLNAGVVDELHLTICPMIFGGQEAPTISDGRGVERLADASRFELKSMRKVGSEVFLVYSVLQPERPQPHKGSP